MKCDHDPTETIALNIAIDVTYKQIFYEIVQFIANNNTSKRYLKYPEMYLNSNKSKCNNKNACKECNNSNNKNVFSLCLSKRREMGNKLFDTGQLRDCMSDSLERVARQLIASDKMLIKASSEYKLKENWFAKVYSYLKWQQEAVDVLLHNLVGLDQWRKNDENYTDCNDLVMTAMNDEMAQDVFLDKFDLLTLFHSYLSELVDYVVLYYCCFDSQNWISVFYPFIETAIGTSQCCMLLAESKKHSKRVLTSLCGRILDVEEDNDTKKTISKEMKGIVIFKRLLFSAYEKDIKNDVQDIDIVFNPFDLAVNIGSKLKESVSNIKTQLMINEITDTNLSGSGSVGNGVDDNLNNEEKKDNWTIDDSKESNNNNYNVKVPSFIRLFTLQRILGKCIGGNWNSFHDESISELFGDVANVFESEETNATAKLILARLMNHGIKTYMKDWYSESKQAQIIEDIFHRIILVKLGKEYHDVMTFTDSSDSTTIRDDTFYRNLVFNSSDVMCEIFQYLKWGWHFDGDLFCCSLVNSHWLYHSWNVNSVYHVTLDELIYRTLKYSNNTNNNISNVTRQWQRFIYAKSIEIDFFNDLVSDYALIMTLNNLSLLKSIEKINAILLESNINVMNIAMLKMIMSRSKNKAKHCDILINTPTAQQLSPLRLPKVTFITINDLYFYRIWSNKCTNVRLSNVTINNDCCQFWIDNCDFSNINILELHRIKFDYEIVLKQLASKFSKLGKLIIGFHNNFDEYVILFWQLLTPIILKNNGKVELNIGFLNEDRCSLLNGIMIEYNLNIQRLSFTQYRPASIKFVQQRDDCGLEHLHLKAWNSMAQLVAQLSFKSLTSFEACGSSNDINNVNDLLELDIIVNKQLFVIVDQKTNLGSPRLFAQLCQNICRLFGKQIAIDIKITFNEVDKVIYQSCYQTYSMYFQSEKMLHGYKVPQSQSQLCSPRIKPEVYFVRNEKKSFTCKATNVHNLK